MRPATRLVAGRRADPYGASSPPLYQTATFRQADPEALAPYDYTRSGNPTRAQLEERVADLEGARHGFAFASGMAALSAWSRELRDGDRVLAGADLYGGTVRLLERVLAPRGVRVDVVDTTRLGEVDRALRRGAAWMILETPTNPLMRESDLAAVAARCRDAGARLCVDNSLLSPWLQNPLDLGADVVVHSATKHLAGHADATAGVVVCDDDGLAERLAFTQNAEGAALAPFEAWLVLRGIQTLGVRLEHAQRTAARVAEHLAHHEAVTRVHVPGSTEASGPPPGQRRGAGSVLSFETGSEAVSLELARHCRLFGVTVSFGGTGSTLCLPCRMSHASIPAESERAPLPRDLVRLSIGLEDADDLIEDLDAAFAAAIARSLSE